MRKPAAVEVHLPAGEQAAGYKGAAMHGAGAGWALHGKILETIYGGDEAKAKENLFGEVLYNRGILNAIFSTEASWARVWSG